MPLERVDFFMPPVGHYDVLQAFTKDLYEAFLRQGVKCRLLVPQWDNPQPFLESIFSDPPQCTFSINGLLPDTEGHFFCDMIKLPHVAYVMDSPAAFSPLVNGAFNIIVCSDQFSVEFFKGLNSRQTFYLPEGVRQDIEAGPSKRTKEISVFATCVDIEVITKKWEEEHSKDFSKAMQNVAEEALKNPSISYLNLLVEAINDFVKTHPKTDPRAIDYIALLDQLENYMRGKERIELVRHLKGFDVHLFGAKDQGKTWKKYLEKTDYVQFHEPVPYDETISVMQQSKIVLNAASWQRSGLHNKFLTGMAVEALAVTAENPEVTRAFKGGEELLTYRYGQWDELTSQLKTYLQDDTKRMEIGKKGREAVLKDHTWDHRVSEFQKTLMEMIDLQKELV